jgi:hypothetical protein
MRRRCQIVVTTLLGAAPVEAANDAFAQGARHSGTAVSRQPAVGVPWWKRICHRPSRRTQIEERFAIAPR